MTTEHRQPIPTPKPFEVGVTFYSYTHAAHTGYNQVRFMAIKRDGESSAVFAYSPCSALSLQGMNYLRYRKAMKFENSLG